MLHGDIDTGLPEYGDKSFDYVILDQSLQQVMSPDTVLTEALRVGKWVIVGFPNFANLSARLPAVLQGPHAGHAVASLRVARHAEPAFPQHLRLLRVLPSEEHQDRAHLLHRPEGKSEAVPEPARLGRDLPAVKRRAEGRRPNSDSAPYASYSKRIVKLYIPIAHTPFSVDPGDCAGTSTAVSPDAGSTVR